MGLLEKGPSLCKGINMRSSGLGVTSKAANPVVQVIHRDKKNVRLLSSPRNGGQYPNRHHDKNNAHLCIC